MQDDKDLLALKALAHDAKFFGTATAEGVLKLYSVVEHQASRIAELEGRLSRHDEAANNAINAALTLSPAVDLSGLTLWHHNEFSKEMHTDPCGEYVKLTAVQALLASTANTLIGKSSVCVCGEPETEGVTHRTDGPCYVTEGAAPARDVGGLTDSDDAMAALSRFWSHQWTDADGVRQVRFEYAQLDKAVREVLATKEAEVRNAALEEAAKAAQSAAPEGYRWVADHCVAAIDALATSPAPSVKQEATSSPNASFDAWVKPRSPMLDTAHNRNIYCAGFNAAVKIAAPTASQGEVKVPEGFKLVPIAPTPAMLLAGVKGFQKAGYNDCDKLHDWAGCYAAMIAAAPSVTDGE